MSKNLGSWSGMRKYLESDMLAESLKGRITYGCTSYPSMEFACLFDIRIDGKVFKRFSHETLNDYFVKNGYKSNSEPYGRREYWAEYWELADEVPVTERTEYSDREFCRALETYRNQSIEESLVSKNPLVKMFAFLDRRTGKRTLDKLKSSVLEMPVWLQTICKIRFDAEQLI